MHIYRLQVSFGDCDPAGIVFYPNIFRWMDASFHDLLRSFGGHGQICRDLGAMGVGLTSASASFRSPLRDGDVLDVRLSVSDSGEKSLDVSYEGVVDKRVAFQGNETRALFVKTDRGISTGDVRPLLAIIASTKGSSDTRT